MKQPEFVAVSDLASITPAQLADPESNLLIHRDGLTVAVIVPYGHYMKMLEALGACSELFENGYINAMAAANAEIALKFNELAALCNIARAGTT